MITHTNQPGSVRATGITLTYDPDQHALRAGAHDAVSITIDRRTPTGRR
jgi:hypothetical protein